MKRILTIVTLLFVFTIPAKAGEIPLPADCPPEGCPPPAAAPAPAPPADESGNGPESATLFNEAMAALVSGILSALR